MNFCKNCKTEFQDFEKEWECPYCGKQGSEMDFMASECEFCGEYTDYPNRICEGCANILKPLADELENQVIKRFPKMGAEQVISAYLERRYQW